MKTPLIAISVLLLAGCESSRTIPTTPAPLTTQQAGARSLQLANDKADAIYNRRPFGNKQPAHFENGRWVWTSIQGVGLLDYHATVELAADGSTNHVEVRLTDDAVRPKVIVPNGGGPPAPVSPYIRK